MKNLRNKNVLIAFVLVLIVSGACGKANVQLKDIFCFTSEHNSLTQSDCTHQFYSIPVSEKNYPFTPPTLFENQVEINDDSDPEENLPDLLNNLFSSLYSKQSRSKVSIEKAAFSLSVFVPLYILFLSWKSYLP